ncbi:c-type cytochrome biogenesis protein CcsB [Tessaracoccus sp. MC1679]|jgi:cytochrome c-type biogenesis protein CcsB|uniref:c-type cytochrome biogenesis protein CcsB n=1 Tax=Tessaracoccus sp. MC1679 TaxID=2760313 RepID=UPI001602AD31|nr:c-type cytochrome biogenesis protein CcsB [Tessaracoccus sp. MC1679]MBB1515020.1 c-type cytochrome biogenesis protein CcsB [Tessaracoccus sp. MC1679]HRA04307.1 c-type cytochrome biogenesis protein CcsB [Arachnia sp.]
MLEFAEYLVTAAAVFVLLGLVSGIALVTSRRRNPVATVSVRAKVSVGGAALAPAQSEAPVQAGRGTSLGWYATAFQVIALLLLTAYMAIRMSLTGHGPFANQHEFAVAFTWGILLVNLFFGLRYRIRMLSLVVLPVAAAMLVYALSLDTGVRPLIPALQNNLLLTLHVGFAIIAYGAACVSFGAAVLYLLHPHITRVHLPRQEVLDDVGYRAAVITFPLLTIMIVLGSVWASTAWGRYWGWDPKETAALVTWLVYGAFLHARVVRDWRGTKASWLLVIGFLTILFAYFGNHFFGGLHSYA